MMKSLGREYPAIVFFFSLVILTTSAPPQARAEDSFDPACEAGDFEACRTACEAGNHSACYVAGSMYLQGVGVEPDVDQAAAFLTRACDGGLGVACLDYADRLTRVDAESGFSQDLPQARVLAQKACSLDQAKGCAILGFLNNQGLGGAIDKPKARALYEKACQAGETVACHNLGGMFHQGVGGEADLIKALVAFERACEMGDRASCDEASELAGDGGSPRVLAYRACQALDVTACETLCDQGSAQDCFRAAIFHHTGQGTKKNLPRALSNYTKACDRELIPACTNLAEFYLRGLETDKDEAKAAGLLGKACKKNDPIACDNLAEMHRSGTGVTKDIKVAVGLYGKACEAGHKSACTNLGSLFNAGLEVPKDTRQAKLLFMIACTEDPRACSELSQLHRREENPPSEEKTAAINAREKACSGGDPVECEKLAMMLSEGDGVEVDWSSARTYYQIACNDGHLGACHRLGVAFEIGVGGEQDAAKAQALYQKSCDGDHMEGCFELGMFYRRQKPPNFQQAASLLTLACDAKMPKACYNVARNLMTGEGVVSDPQKARGLLKETCDGGLAMSCSMLGGLFAKEKSFDEAKPLFEKACDGGDSIACSNLGQLHYFGNGVKADKVKAAKYYLRACERGQSFGCRQLRQAAQSVRRDKPM